MQTINGNKMTGLKLIQMLQIGEQRMWKKTFRKIE